MKALGILLFGGFAVAWSSLDEYKSGIAIALLVVAALFLGLRSIEKYEKHHGQEN